MILIPAKSSDKRSLKKKPGAGFRFLKKGEIRLKTDECWVPSSKRWYVLTSLFYEGGAGHPHDYDYNPTRRKLDASKP